MIASDARNCWSDVEWDTRLRTTFSLPLNTPDLDPLDYSIWQVMQDWVYKTKIDNVDQLKQRIVRLWNEMEQTVIDRAVNQWHKRLQICVQARGSWRQKHYAFDIGYISKATVYY